MATLAFNVVGGLTRPSGGYIAAYTLLAVLIGISYKVLIGEPGQSNLQQPELTIEVYLGAITAMGAAAYLSRRFVLNKPLIRQFKSNADMGRAALSCSVIGIFANVYLAARTSTAEAGSLLSALEQLNAFLIIGIVAGMIYEIRRSGGRRSLNLVTMLACILTFVLGVITYSKQGIFTAFVCWILAVASQRYKVSLLQIGSLILAAGFISYYLVPYSQYGRSFRIEGGSFSENLKINILLLSNLDKVRTAFKEQNDDLYTGTDFSRYYNEPQGLADRLQMITPDDLIVNYTAHGGVFGLEPTIFGFENLIPHFIWHDKPIIGFGNVYAHEIGMISDETDTTTGISFSPAGEAFHQAKWAGIFILLPILLFFYFLIVDSVCGDTRSSPFSLLVMIGALHSAPEGGVGEIIRGPTVEIMGLILLSSLVIYLMPLIANLILGPVKADYEAPTTYT
ncbi:hypothetical protein [Granulicella arctica]|uniref:hypothetical protein n=1 Tax=Granulicella arctica TaxID=940613 RepID=UPI0021E0FC07|nr:hypothetical protein [Granulicella arctica]